MPLAELPSSEVLRHVVDVHCHPTDAPSILPESMEKLGITICAMSSRASDQSLVYNLAKLYPKKVIPCFGHHPWFSHLICLRDNISKEDHYRELFSTSRNEDLEALTTLLTSLPHPIPLSSIIIELRRNLQDFPDAMLGEVGLDRAFRIPYDYDASPRKLSPFTVPIQHQMAVLQAQMDLAVELHRNISLHSVKAHQPTMELLANMEAKHGTSRWNKISLDLHSCGCSSEMLKDIQRRYPNIFLSLSTVINGRSPNHLSLIKVSDPLRILVESDYNDVDMCAEQSWNMVCTVADVRGWTIETDWNENSNDPSKWGAVRRLEDNWERFKVGNHSVNRKK
ncbi:TatD related DNase-domain-containing protein [Lentinula aciculospora]|uniref:TatD related DNase-domain-containing protein n=1 Tax=Lentinula aciculospora TaxID=153920 RepID=A0A9W9DTV0_9AGAR|nr:TatD related DNase-domain-containing protein [Lentinula aciculospora]